MPVPSPRTAHMSITPLEPVLVFRNAEDAKTYQEHYNSMGRIYRDSTDCVFLPLPPGLNLVRTSRQGEIAFEFKTALQAEDFGRVIKVGRMYAPEGMNAERMIRTVYVGHPLF